ncbi:acyl-CoA N-acyltransferase [Xylariaceae sp. FL0594]|nr:acyl-CoA N-acyltransferase [Xylariaceae sp. FL0594]
MPKSWITVTTTLPLSLGDQARSKDSDAHTEILTPRLLIRPLTLSDLVPFHRLRSQPEFMKHTTSGLPDKDLSQTQQKLESLIDAPRREDQFPFPTYFGVFLRETGELIGDGGIHLRASPACGWPELGCKFGREYCGAGYGTEFFRAFTSWWWSLPRQREGEVGSSAKPALVQIRVHPDSVIWEEGESGGRAVEQLYCWVTPDNLASQSMVIKTGFEHFINWEHPVKGIAVMGWRQNRHRRSVYPAKL